jgi:hypothetical protein
MPSVLPEIAGIIPRPFVEPLQNDAEHDVKIHLQHLLGRPGAAAHLLLSGCDGANILDFPSPINLAADVITLDRNYASTQPIWRQPAYPCQAEGRLVMNRGIDLTYTDSRFRQRLV